MFLYGQVVHTHVPLFTKQYSVSAVVWLRATETEISAAL